jgi:hypothetical protein
MFAIGFDSPDALNFAGSAVLGVAIIAAWVILASSRFIQGGAVERPERVPQLYGYTICLIALFWALTSAVHVVESSLTLSNPEYRDRDFGIEASITSFEAFRMTYDRSRRMMSSDSRVPLDTLSDAELHRRYEALRTDRIARNTVGARRSLIVSTLSLLIAIAVFVVHWRWLRRSVGAPGFGGSETVRG